MLDILSECMIWGYLLIWVDGHAGIFGVGSNADLEQMQNYIVFIKIINNNMQNEYIDLPINLQDTPKHLLEKVQVYKVPESADEAAHQLLQQLQTLLKGTPNEWYVFYQNVMASTYRERFVDAEWPTTGDLESKFEVEEYKQGAQIVYKEFGIRTSLHKIKAIKQAKKYADIVDEAWEEYTSIFEREYARINFSPENIWDFFDGFLDLFLFHKSKSVKIAPQASSHLFNVEQTKSIFNGLTKNIPTTYTPNPTVKQLFGYYSLTALAVVAVSEANYKEALQHISRISLKETIVYTKAMGSLLTTFFIAAFSYFMLEDYEKSVKICQTIVPFYHKYRKFYDKSFSYLTQMQPLFEKLVSLQCINYIFLEEKPKTAVMEIFKNTNVKTKEKQQRDKISDCFSKMKQNDTTTFWRLFNLLCDDFAIPNVQRTVAEKFKDLQQVNINTIIQNYKRIELQKMAKMLNLTVDQVLGKINSIGASQQNDSPWDSTILNPLLKQKKKVNVIIEGSIANFDSQNADAEESARQWKRYRDEIGWLHEKVKGL